MQPFQDFQIFGLTTKPIELFGALTALWCVYLTVRQNIWCWPVGIVSAVAYGVLFWVSRLYADMWLQVFFTATSGFGWVWWLRGGPRLSPLPVTGLSHRQRPLVAALSMAAILVVGGVHANYTNAALPYLDATASGASVTAQLLMMRKKIECWPLWIAINILSIYIYIYSRLFLTAGLYALLLILAVLGWQEWRQSLRSQNRLPLTAPLPEATP